MSPNIAKCCQHLPKLANTCQRVDEASSGRWVRAAGSLSTKIYPGSNAPPPFGNALLPSWSPASSMFFKTVDAAEQPRCYGLTSVVRRRYGSRASSNQRANLARIRDNQRRSRARRREYMQELEQKLRACELQGVEASTEVQIAARRVADENVKLRELLHKHGATDEYIAQYLQEYAGQKADCSSELDHNAQAMDVETIPTPQSLEQLMLPRRPAHLEFDDQFTSPSLLSREISVANGSTILVSAWKCSQPTLANYNHQPHQVGLSPSTTSLPDDQQYLHSMFHAQSGGNQPNLFPIPCPEHLMDGAQQTLPTPQPNPMDDSSSMTYDFQMN
ncbi:hypothetical protein E4U21_007079 [Claviceps maximensis]|nr:hypothetical protein E4U21_007079 [Claviceps maximensis]